MHSNTNHVDLENLLETEDYLVQCDRTSFSSDVHRAVVSFTGIGLSTGGIQRAEFLKSSGEGSALFVVTDKHRTWGNSLDVARISQTIIERASGRPIHTLGNSMGGFLSILFSSPLRAVSSISFAGQYSVHPNIVPRENRWSGYRSKINRWWYPSLEGHFNRVTNYTTINGQHGDRRQWSKYPKLPNARHYVYPGVGHDVAKRLKEDGTLYEIIEWAFSSAWPQHDVPSNCLRQRDR
ncbi:hypothetical protein Q0601_14985 [Paracoccus onubensis]|uniref:hypothetical protein n=1 Tax=Paracoccus onubensis TaxID=1675788 RepID=UPI0027317AD6|nr:hypothetical protein [Paracoccus onubensis]MDP0928489.1 hypothetical protein [Paracoccus onubensis]